MPRFFVERATPDEADILVEGRVTLFFRRFKNIVWKVAATTHDRGKATVSKKDFVDARALAIKKMNEAHDPPQMHERKAPPQEYISDELVARTVLKDAHNRDLSIETALDVFLESAKWCKSSRWSIISEINKIRGAASGAASKKRAQARRQERDKARQFNLPLSH